MIDEKKIKEAARMHTTGNMLYECHKEAFEQGAKWALEQSQWIAVEDQLPGEDVMTVAIVYNNPFFGTMTQERGAAYYSGEDKKWYSELTGGRLITIEVHNVTHWQPLPEPPKQ